MVIEATAARIRELSGTARVYHGRVPDIDPVTRKPPAFPYVEFRIPSLTESEARDDGLLEVDIWDCKPTTAALERLTDAIDGDGDLFAPTGLHRWSIYQQDAIAARFYRMARLSIPDPDPVLRRRQLRYRVLLYLTRG